MQKMSILQTFAFISMMYLLTFCEVDFRKHVPFSSDPAVLKRLQNLPPMIDSRATPQAILNYEIDKRSRELHRFRLQTLATAEILNGTVYIPGCQEGTDGVNHRLEGYEQLLTCPYLGSQFGFFCSECDDLYTVGTVLACVKRSAKVSELEEKREKDPRWIRLMDKLEEDFAPLKFKYPKGRGPEIEIEAEPPEELKALPKLRLLAPKPPTANAEQEEQQALYNQLREEALLKKIEKTKRKLSKLKTKVRKTKKQIVQYDSSEDAPLPSAFDHISDSEKDGKARAPGNAKKELRQDEQTMAESNFRQKKLWEDISGIDPRRKGLRLNEVPEAEQEQPEKSNLQGRGSENDSVASVRRYVEQLKKAQVLKTDPEEDSDGDVEFIDVPLLDLGESALENETDATMKRKSEHLSQTTETNQKRREQVELEDAPLPSPFMHEPGSESEEEERRRAGKASQRKKLVTAQGTACKEATKEHESSMDRAKAKAASASAARSPEGSDASDGGGSVMLSLYLFSKVFADL